MIDPEDCRDMAGVRAGIDELDAEIVKLLARRFRFIEAAARIKPRRDQVRDEPRKSEVIANARRAARQNGAPEELIGRLYEMLVEGSIAHEFDEFDARGGE